MNETVDDVAARVRALVESPEGKGKVARFNKLIARIEKNVPTLRKLRARLHRRAGMQLYINASIAQHATDAGSACMSVRVHGVECGRVTVNADKKRTFAPSNQRLFERCGYQKVQGLEWEAPGVAKFIRACVDAVEGHEVDPRRPEARVESDLILQMKVDGASLWRFHQPVCLAGMPLQVPLPITASGAEPTLGDGHIDVLARLGRGGKGLRVYEVKRPTAPIDGALNQAVAYSVALKILLTQGDATARHGWWRLLEFSSQPKRMPRLEAFAYVADNPNNRSRLEEARHKLETSNRENITVGAIFY